LLKLNKMQTAYKSIVITLLFYFSMSYSALFAQSPQLMSYQAVIRDANNALVVNAPVGMQISILQGAADGPAVYVETHQATTNANGLLSLVVGGGDVISGAIDGIDWSQGPYFIKTETDPSGGTNYTITGTSQLLSVPYALWAEKASAASNGLEPGTQLGQVLYWDGGTWYPLEPGPQNQVLTMCDGVPTWTPGGNCEGMIGSLDCENQVVIGSLIRNWPADDVRIEVPYSGGNGGAYVAQRIMSSGVLGLEAILQAGFFAQGDGVLTFQIKGSPASAGMASFTFNVGGHSCQIDIEVSDNGAALYPQGSVFCLGLPTQIVDVFSPNTGKTWMDRNLGAGRAAQSSTDELSYGDLYQWGRFADGHQCRLSPTTTDLSPVDNPTHGKFIITDSEPFDWRTNQNDDLWAGVNGINNPCPLGYRVPSAVELHAETVYWSNNTDEGAINSPLKMPISGNRETWGTIGNFSSRGLYWTTTVNGRNVYRLHFFRYGLTFDFPPRGSGNSIRCIKD
jgi:hypothetical protein